MAHGVLWPAGKHSELLHHMLIESSQTAIRLLTPAMLSESAAKQHMLSHVDMHNQVLGAVRWHCSAANRLWTVQASKLVHLYHKLNEGCFGASGHEWLLNE